MLDDGLTGTERSGNRGNTALGDGEEAVDDTLTGDQRGVGSELGLVGTALTDRPLLGHGDIHIALFGLNDRYGLADIEGAGLDRLDLSGNPVGDHYLLCNNGCLLDSSDDVTGFNLVADSRCSHEVPLLLLIEGGNFDTAGQPVRAGHLHDDVQGPLDTIVDGTNEAGSEVNRKGNLHGLDGLAGSETGRLFVYLYGSLVTVHLDDLADQSFLADTDDIVHIGIAHS